MKPFDVLSFPLAEELCENMLKTMPDYQRSTSIGDDTSGCGSSHTNQPVIDGMLMNSSSIMMNAASSSQLSTSEMGADEDNNLSSYPRIYPVEYNSDEETESVESGLIDEDPNDPEWCEPLSRT